MTRLSRLSSILVLAALAGSAEGQTPTPTPTATPTVTPTPPPGSTGTVAGRTLLSFPDAGRYDAANMVLDPDGKIWTASGSENALARISADLREVTRWTLTRDATPSSILKDPGGNLWLTELGGFRIAKFEPGSNTLTEWADGGRRPTALVRRPDGTFWLPETGALLTLFDPATGTFTYHRAGLFSLSYPWMDPDGTLWAADFLGGAIVRFAADGSAATLWRLPDVTVQPSKIIRGADGALWISFYLGGQLARFDPETAELKTFNLNFSLPYDLLNYRGRIVYSEQQDGFIGFLEPQFAEVAATGTLTATALTITKTVVVVSPTTTTLTPRTDPVTSSGPSDTTGFRLTGLTEFFAGYGDVWAMAVDERRGRIFYGTAGGIGILSPPVFSATDQLLPAAASIEGRGGVRWKTQLVTWNRGSSALTVGQRLHPSGWIAGLMPLAVASIEPGHLLVQDDPIANELGGPDTYGGLRVAATTPADLFTFERVARMREDGATYGFARNPLRSADAVGANESGYLFTPPGGSRTNAGLFVVEDAKGTYAILDSSGAPLATQAFDWPAGYHYQGSTIFQSLGLETVPSARFVVSVTSGRVLFFGTGIDTETNDPIDLLPFTPRGLGTELRLTGVARGAGLLGAGAVTDLQLHSAEDTTVTLTFRAAAPPSGASPGPVSATVAVPAGRVVTLLDVLGTTLGVTAGQGLLEVASTAPVGAFARVTAPDGAGRHGYGVAGLPPSAADVAAGFRGVYLAAADNAGIRTDLLLANLSDAPAVVTLTLTHADGTSAGSREVTLPPRAAISIPSVWSATVGAAADAGRLDVTPADGSGPVASALIRQDALSGDADALVPQRTER